MELIYFLFAGLGAFAILHFAWIPAVERRLQFDRSASAIGHSALLAVLGVLRSILLIATLTSVVIVVVMFFLGLLGGASPKAVLSSIETIKEWRDMLTGFGPIWGVIAIIMLVLALAIYARRSAKLRLQGAFKRIFDGEYQRLEKLYEQNQLEPLPLTKEIQEIQAQLAERLQLLEELDRIPLPEGANADQIRQELTKQTSFLQGLLKAQEIQRRMNVKLTDEDVELPKAATKLEKLQTFFMSRGLVTNLSRVSRLVYVSSLVLLVPSLMGVYSGKVGPALDKRVVELHNLRITLESEQVEQQLQNAKNQLGEPKNELSDDDKSVIEEAAQTFEAAIAESHLSSISSTISSTARFSMRSTLVRDRILSRNVRRAGSVLEKVPSGSQAANLRPLEQEVVRVSEIAFEADKPPTQLYKNLRADLEDAARRSPRFVDHLKAELKSFQRVASRGDLTHALAKHVAGVMIDGTGQGELGRIIQGASQTRNPSAIQSLHETQSRRFVLELVHGKSVGQALNTVTTSVEMAEVQPIMRTVMNEVPINQINNTFREYPPSVSAASEPHVNLNKAAAEIEKLRNLAPNPQSVRTMQYTEALTNFDDWFPSQFGADSRTPSSDLRNRWASGGGSSTSPGSSPGFGSPSGSSGGSSARSGTSHSSRSGSLSTSNLAASRSSFTRSRSFFRLRGFSRVGGVLIGIDSVKTTTPTLNFNDLKWELQDGKIKLILINSDGQTFRSIPHRLATAYYALNYAADGRPLAVTMIKAPPMIELKILLHPVLIDNPMGYRIIELDRFVDKYTGEDPGRDSATNAVYAQNALYQLAWANRAFAALKPMMASQYDTPQEILDLARYLKSIINSSEIRLQAQAALRQPKALKDPIRSPLTAKSEFYDEPLVDLIIACAEQTTDLDEFEMKIKQAAENVFDGGETQLKRWLTDPPTFDIWSGVREKEFDLHPKNFMMLEGAESSLPFDFMLQVAFTSSPQFLPYGRDETDDESYSDTKPWEFPAVKKQIHQKVLTRAQNDYRDRVILADAAEFTYLQRFFRLAFQGHFGANFPVEKLAELSEVLEINTPQQKMRTLRWNARPGIENMLRVGMSDENREQVTQILKIRRELGIWKDEEQSLREHNAPLPSLN